MQNETIIQKKPCLCEIYSDPMFEKPLQIFLETIAKNPNFCIFQNAELESNLKNKICRCIEEDIKIVIKKLSDRFEHGEFDLLVFSKSPQINDDLKIILEYRNRIFVRRLFLKSDSLENLRFWLDDGKKAKLTTDSLVLSIILGCNTLVLQYLKEKIGFNNLSNLDKKELLMRGKRFKGTEGYNFLLKAFNI